jgi:hypothetical protein
MTCGTDVLAQLRADFPGWAIGRPPVLAGGRGSWMATRKELLGTDEVDGGLSHTLTADTAGQLRSALAAQRRLEMSAFREPV